MRNKTGGNIEKGRTDTVNILKINSKYISKC